METEPELQLFPTHFLHANRHPLRSKRFLHDLGRQRRPAQHPRQQLQRRAKLLMPLAPMACRVENARMMEKLKAYAESDRP
jgi:hypothetical protein